MDYEQSELQLNDGYGQIMTKTAAPTFSYVTRNYYLLTKPGIIFGNLMTTAGGFALGCQGRLDVLLILKTLVGLGLVIASSCVFNNYIDREADRKMARTKQRPLATGAISNKNALLFAIFMGIAGTSILGLFTNLLTLTVALLGFAVYVILYSFSKYHTIHGTLIGSIAGAVPPVVGYTAVSNQLDSGAWIFFAMLVLWQMPHFLAIAIYRLKDYTKASIPLLPVKKGIAKTKVHMLLYIFAFTGVSTLLTLFHFTGMLYLATATLLGAIWAWLCVQGFKCANDELWARKMFLFSLVVIMAISIVIPFSLRI